MHLRVIRRRDRTAMQDIVGDRAVGASRRRVAGSDSVGRANVAGRGTSPGGLGRPASRTQPRTGGTSWCHGQSVTFARDVAMATEIV
jgi:hypothetical protein